MTRRSRDTAVQEMMATLAAGVAHEVRNPLNAVQINLTLLGDELRRLAPEGGELARELLEKIVREIRSLDDFVSEFLRFARPPKPRLVQVSTRALLADLASFMAPECRRRGVELVVTAERGPELISADPLQLKHALLNLILNAMQASPADGRIEVHSSGDPGRLVVLVKDQGAGIPAESLDRVFDPFFTTREGGTGLGLSIARHIAQAHGGTLALANLPDGGVAARIELPVRPEARR